MPAAIPQRYDRTVAELFDDALARLLRPGHCVLDFGSGRRPAVSATRRPAGCRYIGLDISAAELARAPIGSYADVVVSDILAPVPSLREQFDLVLSAQVLEHVKPLGGALANLRNYLRPGGHLAAVLSGRFSLFGALNRMIPATLATRLMAVLLDRAPDTVFPAHYDGCYARALAPLFAQWSAVEITPLYQGGSYFNFCLPLRSLYFSYENWAVGNADLATHYLIVARR